MNKNLLSLADLFEGRVLAVPDYQRGYAWEEPQLRDLVEDLQTLRHRQVHYTGTVVLHSRGEIERDEAHRKLVVHDVVDGQQRLTSCTILLSVLRRELASVQGPDSPMCEELARSYLWVRAPGSALDRPRLRLYGDLGEHFEGSILRDEGGQDGPRTVAAQRLTRARRFFEGWFAERREERADAYAAWLVELLERVTEQLRCTLFEVESEAEVGVIFEVMNNRGKPLSELEKVKNYLLYVAAKVESDELATRINGSWARVLTRMMEGGLTKQSEEDRLLRLHWLLTQDHDERNWDGYRSIKARFDLRSRSDEGARLELQSDIDHYLRTLEETVIALRDIEKPARADAFAGLSHEEGVRAELSLGTQRLHRIGILRPFRPFLAGVRMRARDPLPYLAALKACERFSFLVYAVAGYRAHTGRTSFNALGRRVYDDDESVDEAVARVERSAAGYCGAATYDAFWKLDDENPRDFYRWGALRYLLYEYEIHRVGSKGVKIAWETMHTKAPKTTIEHILPQGPSKPYWQERFTEDDIRVFTHDLGNLSLTKDNSSYGNKTFPDKRGDAGQEPPGYAVGHYRSEQDLAGWKEWTPATIRERRERLVEWARTRWPHHGEVEVDEDEIAAEAETTG